MDISSIGMQQLSGAYVPLSHNSQAPGLNSMEGGSFKDLLQRAQNAQGRITGEASVLSEAPKPALNKAPIDKNDKLYELCMELETFLIKNLIKSMRGTVQKSELIQTGFAGGIYEDMLYDEYAKEYAKNANFGFAEMAYRELSAYNR